MTPSFWTFLALSALVVATPGPDTALVVRSSLAGRRAGLATAAGVAVGQLLWASAASAGLVALLVASEPVFQAVKWLGAAYLIWLGTRSLLGAVRGSTMAETQGTVAGNGFAQGVLGNLGNPKMTIFFSSLLPQFAQEFAGLATLGLVFAAMTFAWLAAYAVLASLAGAWLRRGPVRRAVEAVTGAALVALGLRLAWAER